MKKQIFKFRVTFQSKDLGTSSRVVRVAAIDQKQAESIISRLFPADYGYSYELA